MQEPIKGVSPVANHTFNRAADETIRKANAISNGRAGEYQDSWSTSNLVTPWLDELLRNHPAAPAHLAKHHKRLIVMASMLDIKLSRLGGNWKEDTVIDSINYLAAYGELRRQYESDLKASLCRDQLVNSPGISNLGRYVQDLAGSRETLGNAGAQFRP